MHFALLEATSTPLYAGGRLGVYVHNAVDQVIRLASGVKLPKTYRRFEGLMQQLFRQGRIESEGVTLIRLKRQGFGELLASIHPSYTVGLSRLGERSGFEEVAARLAGHRNPVVVVGGFPRGRFSKRVSDYLQALHSVHELPLEAHVVVARLLYEFEKRVLPAKT